MSIENYEYDISVVMAVYNAEEYLDETINCVINQTFGIDRIQLILVDDGSTDESGNICSRYVERHPRNILYIKKENGGVSSARNLGLDNVAGKYVIFLDSDDAWRNDAFDKIFNYFEENGKTVDVCSCKIEYIGDFEGKVHPLNYKFKKGKRTVSLEKEPEMTNSTIGNTAFRSRAIGETRFNERISAGEDAEFTNSVLIKNPYLGIVPDAIFFYRRNYEKSSGSSGAPFKKSWYLEVPKEYYLSLCDKSIREYGKVVPFIQRIILYDLRWRHYNEEMMHVLTEDEKQYHIKLMHKVLANIDYEILFDANGLDNYTKLYFMNLKYGKDIVPEAELKEHGYWYKGEQILSFWGRGFFQIRVLNVSDGMLILEGITRAAATKRDFKIYALDEKGNKHYATINRFKNYDRKGFIGENVAETNTFKIEIPAYIGCSVQFFTEIEGKAVKTKADYDPYIGIAKRARFSFCIRNGYIVRYKRDRITLCKHSLVRKLALEALLILETIRRKDKALLKRRLYDIKHINLSSGSAMKNRVAFISVRSDEELKGSMADVYDALKLPKVKYAKLQMYKSMKDVSKGLRITYSSRIVVTDDYLFMLRNYGKKKGQVIIQLWHATGAGKHFGQDGTGMFPPIDAQYHKDYDAVTVSSEYIRPIYAGAFGISVDKVFATGVARTDAFFADNFDTIRKRTLDDYPELRDKKVILYVPTFRDVKGGSREVFEPDIDFDLLSESIDGNAIFVIKPHPVMTAPILPREYDNIIEIRDCETNDLLIVSDMLISDYSSVMFEYSLLRKPMAFYCYDYDDYDRDFYMDFENELPGPMFRKQDELISFINKKEHNIEMTYESFYEKYMGACDGKSTERIVEMINRFYLDDY